MAPIIIFSLLIWLIHIPLLSYAQYSKSLGIVDIATSYDSVCVIFNTKNMKCWGNNSFGQLGVGDTINRGDDANELGESLPFVDIGSDAYPISIHGGLFQFCVILSTSQVKCWGKNDFGQLGQGDNNHRGDVAGEMGDNLPTIDFGTNRTVISIATGMYHFCAILDNLDVKCIGRGTSGQLGYENKLSVGLSKPTLGDNLPPLNFGADLTIVSIHSLHAAVHTCALFIGSKLKCWGSNIKYQLGYPDLSETIGGNSNEMGDNLPVVDVGTGKTIKQVGVGSFHTCVILDDNLLRCWGAVGAGQTGTGMGFSQLYEDVTAMGDAIVPAQLGTGRTAIAMSLGEDFTCAVLDDGSLKCFGINDSGQLGLSTTDKMGGNSRTSGDKLPAVNLGTTSPIFAVKCGGEFTCVVFSGRKMKCFGSNDKGQLGYGDSNSRGDNSGEMGAKLPFVFLTKTNAPTMSPTNPTSSPTSPTENPTSSPLDICDLPKSLCSRQPVCEWDKTSKSCKSISPPDCESLNKKLCSKQKLCTYDKKQKKCLSS